MLFMVPILFSYSSPIFCPHQQVVQVVFYLLMSFFCSYHFLCSAQAEDWYYYHLLDAHILDGNGIVEWRHS